MGPLRQFFGDLGACLVILARWPALPVLSAIVLVVPIVLLDLAEPRPGCLEEGGGPCGVGWVLYFVAIPLAIYSAGWYGTERIWYLRAFRGGGLTPSEALGLAFRFIGPFLRLGLLGMLVFVPIFFAATALEDPVWVFVPTFLLLDFLLTFVTPALAYSTRRARTALRMGLRLIRAAWPASSTYVLLPPLAAQALTRFFEPADTAVGLAATMTLAVWVSLWMKGAVARFYLRHHEPEDSEHGSALMATAPPRSPPPLEP